MTSAINLRGVYSFAFLAASLLAFVLVGSAPAFASGSGGGAGSAPSSPSPGRSLSPEQKSEKSYNAGLKYKARAWKAETKAEAAKSDKAKAKHMKRAAKDYRKAQDEFAKVLQILPEHYKAANELGYVLRKQGNYKKAIGAYNYALQLYPEFDQAIEYRAEAFVAIGLYDQAKEAYMHLFRSNSELAEELMTSMRNWRDDLAKEGSTPGARTKDFLQWLEKRQSVSAFGEITEATSSGW